MRSEFIKSGELDKCQPFLKWAGGKRQLLHKITKYIPLYFERYFEPFLGGGAIYFHLRRIRGPTFIGYLSDTNEELINTFVTVRNSVEPLIQILRSHQENYYASQDKRYYYSNLRMSMPLPSIEKAARFIALNRTCFNGLYRVNQKGKFNTPFGKYKHPLICDEENLRNVSVSLKYSESILALIDFEKVLTEKARANDFVYLDPPYNPTSSTSNFTSYTSMAFRKEGSEEVGRRIQKIG